MKHLLAEICEAIVDCEHKTAPAGDGFALSIGTQAMRAGRLVIESCKPVSEATYETWTRRMKPAPGDLVLAREAPIGQVVRVPEEYRVCLGQRTVLIRPHSTRVNPRFLHYWLLGPDAQEAMTARGGGATVAHLNVDDIRSLDVSMLPADRKLQSFVANSLGALDDLIDNNRRRIDLLERMAQAIYREWFVEFGFPGQQDSILVDSRLGQIPEGWGVERLGALVDLDRKSLQPRVFPDELFDHFSIPAFDEGQLPVADLGDTIRSGKFLLTKPAVLVSKLNPRIERTWFAEPRVQRRSVASTEFLVLRPKPSFSLEYVYLMARSAAFQERLREMSGGTSTSHQRARPDEFLGMELVTPPGWVVRRLTDAVRPKLRLSRVLRVENRHLASIRNLLLPRLVAGQIDISHLDLDALLDSVA